MIELKVNGAEQSFTGEPEMPLLWYLRDILRLTGSKFGCGVGLCGACTVHVDGVATRSCLLPISGVKGKSVTTIEALGATPVGRRLQAAWIRHEVPQCGYCQSGQLMSAAALLADTPHPDDADIDAAMAGNICRCGTYARIREAIKAAADPAAAARSFSER